MTSFEISTLNPAVTAADYLLAAVGQEAAKVALVALRADWLTPDEAWDLEPVAVGLAYLLGMECPKHRGADPTITISADPRELADAVSARLRKEES